MRLFALALLLAGCTEAPKSGAPPRPPRPSPPAAPSPPPPPQRAAPPLDAGGPDPTIDWVVDLTPPADGIDRARLLDAFDAAFFTTHDLVELYGLPDGKEAMVPVRATGAPAHYQRLAFGARLITAFSDDDLRIVSRESLDALAADVRARASTLGLAVRPRKTIDEATVEAQRLRALWQKTSIEAKAIVSAPSQRPFDARRAFAALEAAGLARSAEDGLFHAPGFKVRTTTPPGRLIDEKRPLGDLVFVIYFPPLADPARAFDALLRAAETTRKKLGASPPQLRLEIAGMGQVLAPAAARARVTQMHKDMTAGGFPPGGPSTKRLYHLP